MPRWRSSLFTPPTHEGRPAITRARQQFNFRGQPAPVGTVESK